MNKELIAQAELLALRLYKRLQNDLYYYHFRGDDSEAHRLTANGQRLWRVMKRANKRVTRRERKMRRIERAQRVARAKTKHD